MNGIARIGVILAAASLAAAFPPAFAQTAADADLARRTFDNADQLMREGKLEQAVRDFQQIVQSFPESAWADDALMRLGAQQYPAASLWQLGSVAVKGQEAARSYFEQVRERYPQSDSAPQALYLLGLLALEPQSPRRNLDEAYASFSRVVNIYPGSPWVGRAHVGAAFSELEKLGYDRAILSLERALQETPHGAAAAEAQYFLGICNARIGDAVSSAEAFQACRLEAPEGPAAQSALDWLTLLYRVRLLPAAGRPPRYQPAAAFVPQLPAGEDLRGEIHMAVAPSGDIVAADSRRGAILTFTREGRLAKNEPFPGAILTSFDAFGGLVVSGAGKVTAGGESLAPQRKDGAKLEPVERIAGSWRSTLNELYILDRGEGELLLFGKDLSSPRVLAGDKASGARMLAMTVQPGGRVIVLDGKSRGLMVLDRDRLAPLAPGGKALTFEDPVDVASDPLGNLYVLDAKRAAVDVLSPDGARLASISPSAGAPHALEEPGCVAVGPSGEVYVYDKRKRTILLFD